MVRPAIRLNWQKRFRRIIIDRHFRGEWVEDLTQEEILDRLFDDARYIWPDFPTSPLQMDPVIHMMFKAVATRLKEVNDRINNISDAIIRDMACRIFFDGLLRPVPSSTVLKFTAGPSGAEVDESIEVYWINTALKQSTTLYFAPIETKALTPHEAVVALARSGDGADILWVSPQWKAKNQILSSMELSRARGDIDEKDSIYIGIRPEGNSKELPMSDIFISAAGELLGHLKWARWRFTEGPGVFGPADVPGQRDLERVVAKKATPEISLWGYGYFPHEHKEEYRDSFFDIHAGHVGGVPDEIRRSFPGQKGGFWESIEPLYWIEIKFDKRIPAGILKSFELAATNCVIAVNAHFQRQSFFYHGPGPMALEIEALAAQLYEIKCLDDNHGREYQNIYSIQKSGDPQCRFAPRVSGDRLRLLVSPPQRGPAPDRFAVSYRTSIGSGANGVGPGLINSLYNPQPGIESVINLTATRGGVLAQSLDDMIAAFPHVLRSRNRAVVASDFEALSMAFDNRIKSARARSGSTTRNGFMSRCLELEVDLGNFRFVPEEEGKLFAARLARYLEVRSTVGTIVEVKIV